MKFLILPLFALLLILTSVNTAKAAGEIVQCGDPGSVTIETDPVFTYCDIFDRQFAYREKYIDMVSQLEARQKTFIAPSLEARKRHKTKLDALHASINAGAE